MDDTSQPARDFNGQPLVPDDFEFISMFDPRYQPPPRPYPRLDAFADTLLGRFLFAVLGLVGWVLILAAIPLFLNGW